MVRDHHDIFTIFRFFGADSLKEHLAAQLQNQGGAADQFKSAFIKTHNSLAPNPRSAESLSKQNAGFRIANILKPKYACLTCSESFLSSGRKAHTEKSGHQFCKFVSLIAGQPRSNLPSYGVKKSDTLLPGLWGLRLRPRFGTIALVDIRKRVETSDTTTSPAKEQAS